MSLQLAVAVDNFIGPRKEDWFRGTRMKPVPKNNDFYIRIPISHKPIEDLDIEPIKFLLMDETDGLGWSLDKANYIGELYRTFLFLIYKYPDDGVVPTREIDSFWHYHILDTRKYHEDCKKIFGHYIHHNPYLGFRGDGDALELQRKFSHTKMLIRREFPGLA